MVIDRSENHTHYLFSYRINTVSDRKSCLKWIAETSQNSFLMVLHIEVSDLRSFHDGTESRQLNKVEDIDSFVEQYAVSAIEHVSIVGTYAEKPFVLGVYLNSGIIALCCRKRELVDYKELERLLGLT